MWHASDRLQYLFQFSVLAVLILLLPSEASAQTATEGQLIISEFRVRGPNGANDEYIEIYNNSGADHTVVALSGTGYAIVASDGVTRCSIPNGTAIANNGHYLCVNSVGYSLASYPAGIGTTATGDVTYTTDIPDNAGIALFNNNTGGGSYNLANRLDAVGSTSEVNTLYKEGTGYQSLTPYSIDYAWVRDACGKGGAITGTGPCTQAGVPKDTDNNAADFVFVDTNGTSAGGGQRLGAPGPENLSAPVSNTSSISNARLDPCVSDSTAPNFVRDIIGDPANNSTFGTVDIRRTFTNNTGGNLTRLRFRIVDLTTFPAPSGIADLRPRTSTPVVVTVDRSPCGSGTSNVTVEGTTLEQPPSQPNGGGFNSSLGAGTVTLLAPLANGASIDLRFLFGVQQTGSFRVALVIEGLPNGGGAADMLFLNCNTNTGCAPSVTSIVRANPNPTTAASVDFTVNFSQSVTGVDATDFVLTAGAITGASITGIAGSGATYTVTVNTGTGDGVIRLDVVDDDTIVSGAANPLGGTGAGNGNFNTGEVYIISRTPPQLIISEFRLRGPNGANDEFIEIYNNSAETHAVAGTSGTGYAVVASDGVIRFTIPNGIIFPPRGHLLYVNSGGYSLAAYPAGYGTTATGDGFYAIDIPDNAGIALFNNNSGGASFSLANRLDAVGSTSEVNTLYKEGIGHQSLTPYSIDYAWVRDACGKSGSITDMGPCTQAGLPRDTNNNAADFIFVDTNGTNAGGGQRLGAPGPEGQSAPVSNTGSIPNVPLDPCAPEFSPPNFVRDITSDPGNNSTFGTIDIRRTFTNNTGGNLHRLRFRIVDLTTFPAPSGIADLRPRTSTDTVVTVDRAPCGSGTTSNITVRGTTLEQPPPQLNGGGFNSSMGAGTVTLATPLPNGATIDLRFLFGVQQTGDFRVGLVIEGLSEGGGAADFLFLNCNTVNTAGCGVAPVVSSIVRASPDPTAAAAVDFTVNFDRAVTGVDATDFVVTTTGVAGAAVTGVAGSGATRTVTVSTGTGEGTIRLDVDDDDTIVDGVMNPLGGVGAGNGNFTAGEVYSIVRPPQVTAAKTAAFVGTSSIRYTIALTNNGGNATGVIFNDTPDPNTTLVAGSVTTTQGTIVTGNGAGDTSIQINIGTLINGATVTISYIVTVNPAVAVGTVLLNQGTVSGGNFPNVVTDDPGNETGSGDATGITTQAAAIPALSFAGMLALVLLITAAGALFLARRT